ncbi:MAG TPA: 3-deoxy-manno-octulosonate cytidylyltransferase [Spirochaetota bacterium]|nr:3-deoxy-manno-octulosonate cytidylyltransferase [Spirochaetota bacterium]
MKTIAVIPARRGSTRLPDKPLLPVNGKPLICHVIEGVKSAAAVDRIITATDCRDIYKTVQEHGSEAVLTSSRHKTGTDRICEALAALTEKYEIILNIQGDEPLVNREMVTALIKPFKDKDTVMSTLKRKIKNRDELDNPNIVKVVSDKYNNALYFSRAPVPCIRRENFFPAFRHIGMYGFTYDFLLQYAAWQQTTLEQCESLEQLRVLENGYKIAVTEIESETVDVNVAADLKLAAAALKKRDSD